MLQGVGTSSQGTHVPFAAQLGLGTQRGVPSRLRWGVRGVAQGCWYLSLLWEES